MAPEVEPTTQETRTLVSGAPQDVIDANPMRRSLSLQSLSSDQVIWYALDADAAVDQANALLPGQTIDISSGVPGRADGDAFLGRVSCVYGEQGLDLQRDLPSVMIRVVEFTQATGP